MDALAQDAIGPLEVQRVEAIELVVSDVGMEATSVDWARDGLRKAMSIFPGDRVTRQELEFMAARLRAHPWVAAANLRVQRGTTGGLILRVEVSVKGGSQRDRTQPEGALVEGASQGLPVLYQDSHRFLRARLELLSMYYGNSDAWYGRPDLLLQGNPMVQGRPSGAGYRHWREVFVHAGIYGMAPVSDKAYVYGSASAILSRSAGQDLFSDRTRNHFGIEDAYAGLVTGQASDQGDRWVFNISGGRQRFLLGDGFLIANTAANGHERAALQSNARWAADFLGLVQLRHNHLKVEAFHLDPDELPLLDTRTRINGLNVEYSPASGGELAASYLTVPRSTASYYLPDGSQRHRAGLKVYDVRGRWQPYPAGQSGPFLAAEWAVQRNSHFPMRAVGYTAELGYGFEQAAWKPTLSYRYSHFSGDNPKTSRMERWDPLLSGGNAEQWVQGINHFKVVQIGNVNAHRIQLRMRPHPKVELLAQYWLFRADSTMNLGGNPALSLLGSKDYGKELNLTAKVFWTRQLYLHGHIAVTDPGKAVHLALGEKGKKWWSAMVFMRYAF